MALFPQETDKLVEVKIESPADDSNSTALVNRSTTNGRVLVDASTVTVRLDDDVKAALTAPKPKLGNPAVVGLAAFGLTTFVLQLHNFGAAGLGPTIWLGLIFGGLAQMIAGLQEFQSGNNFGYSAFTTYGAFWIALGLMFVGDFYGIHKTTHNDKATFLIAFTLYTLIMFIGSLCIHLALSIVFFTLLIGFVLLDIDNLIAGSVEGLESYDGYRSAAKAFKILAAIDLTICAFGAWYVMAHIIYKDTFGCDMLPVGEPPIKFIRAILAARKRAG